MEEYYRNVSIEHAIDKINWDFVLKNDKHIIDKNIINIDKIYKFNPEISNKICTKYAQTPGIFIRGLNTCDMKYNKDNYSIGPFKRVPDYMKTQEMCYIAIKIDKCYKDYIPAKFMDEKIKSIIGDEKIWCGSSNFNKQKIYE